MTIPDGNINLGRKAQFGTTNLKQLNAGVKKSDMKTPDQIKLFEKFDKDGNNILTENEVDAMKESLAKYADHGKITKREAGKLIKEQGLKGELKKNDALAFLQSVDAASDNIASASYLLMFLMSLVQY